MPPLRPFERLLLFISCSLAVFMMVLDYSIANVSIPYISGDLSVSNDQGTYVITSFAVGNAIGLAMTGWLTKRVGQIRLVVIAISLFTFFSWFCGASISLNMIVIGRFIQGLVAGPVIPLSQSLIVSTGKIENRAKELAIYSMIIITAPLFGPILGGYISDWYIWRWIFYINIPVGILCACTTWKIMKNRESKREKIATDVVGILFLAVGISCLQIFLDKGQQWDWFNSKLIWILSISAFISFLFLVIWELFQKNPLIDLKLFSLPSFSLSIVCLSISYAIYFGTIVLFPLWLQEYMNYNAVWAGIALSSVGIPPIIFSLFTPILMKKWGNVLTLIFSFILFGIACFVSSYLTTQVNLKYLAFTRLLFGFGFTFYITPLLNLSVQEVSEKDLPSSAGIFHFVRAMVGGIGTSVFTTIWSRRTIFHHERINSSLSLFNSEVNMNKTQQQHALLNQSLDQQAALMGINDAFFLMGWLFVLLIIILMGWLFVRGVRRAPSPIIHHQ